MVATQVTSTVESGDVMLFVRRFGSPGKVPILILHGGNYFDSADWVDVSGQLAVDREVAAFDARGFGESGWSPNKYYGYACALGDIRAVLKHLGWLRAIIVGHSRGGSHALLAAARAPEIAAALVLVDYNPAMGFGPPGNTPPAAGGSPQIFPTIEDALNSMTRYKTVPLEPRLKERALQFLGAVEGGFRIAKRDPSFLSPASPETTEGGGPLVLRGGFDEFADTRCPILVIRARKSTIYKAEDLARLKSMDHPEVREVDSGHDVAGEVPGALVTELKDWLHGLNY